MKNMFVVAFLLTVASVGHAGAEDFICGTYTIKSVNFDKKNTQLAELKTEGKSMDLYVKPVENTRGDEVSFSLIDIDDMQLKMATRFEAVFIKNNNGSVALHVNAGGVQGTTILNCIQKQKQK